MKQKIIKRVVIIGATSGIGRRLAEMYLERGNIVGVVGRREEKIRELTTLYPGGAFGKVIDVTHSNAPELLEELLAEMGGMDVFIYSAGVGTQNPELRPEIELGTLQVNAFGFSTMTIYAYNYFKTFGTSGQIAVISSMAGIRALRQAPAYSATKRFNIHYMSCLAQKASSEKISIKFTTIMPGFIKTDMLKYDYPLMVSLDHAAPSIFNAIEKKRRRLLVPARWRWLNMLAKLIPDWLWERL